jgi:hypothetical protein
MGEFAEANRLTNIVIQAARQSALGRGIQINLMVRPELAAAIDAWTATQDEGLTQMRAVRRLIERGLRRCRVRLMFRNVSCRPFQISCAATQSAGQTTSSLDFRSL